jgi:hypothetical protein
MANVKLVLHLRHILLLVFKFVTSKNLSNHSCKNLAMFIEELISYYNIYIKLVFHGSEMEFIEEAIVSCLWILQFLTPNNCEIVLRVSRAGFRKPGNNAYFAIRIQSKK